MSDDEEISFTINNSWTITNFPDRVGHIVTESIENSYCEILLISDIQQQDPLRVQITVNKILDTLPLNIELTIHNFLNEAKNETISESFNFSPSAQTLDIEFHKMPRFYKKSSGFLNDENDLRIDFVIKTKDNSEMAALPSPSYNMPNPYGSYNYFNSYFDHSYSNYFNNNSYKPVDNSKELTGYVGLKNQGATCYMNAFLQSLFHLPAFRRLVYNIHTTGNEDVDTSIPLNLQRLFCELQFSDKACSTKRLTKSFGWGDTETFTQHDAHEFCRVLIDNIERKLQNTELKNSIADLFKGKYKSFIRCKNVEFETSRIEDFYDLQMVVKDCSTLEQSFEVYTEKEVLDGENQYQTDSEYGKQDAEMGIEFIEFPKILHIHLRRFDYDFNYDRQVKINDSFEFPTEINLNDFLGKDSKKNPSSFELFGVLVHSGSVYAGHYYSFLRTSEDPQWFEFNDSTVTKVDSNKAVEDNFGGDKSYSAYILVYVRKDAIKQVFAEIQESTIPKHLIDYMERMKKEEEEREKRQEEQKNQIKLVVLNDKTLVKNTSLNKNGFDSTKENKTIYVEKSKTVSECVQTVKELLEFNQIRLWMCNYYSTPTTILSSTSNETVEECFKYDSQTLYAEQCEEYLSLNDYVVWVKFFFPGKEAPLQYIGSFNVQKTEKVTSLYPLVNRKIGFPENTELISFIEPLSNEPKRINDSDPFTEAAISTGSILILQQKLGDPLLNPTIEFVPESTPETDKESENKEIEKKEEERFDVPVYNTNDISNILYLSYAKYFGSKSKQFEVLIYDFNDYKKPLFYLKFPSITPINELKGIITEKMGYTFDKDKESIEIFKEDEKKPGEPAISPITLVNNLASWVFGGKEDVTTKIFVNYLHDISEIELEKTILLQILKQSDGYNVDKVFRIRIPKNSTGADLKKSLFDENELDANKSYRLSEVWQNKIYKEWADDAQIYYSASPFLLQQIPDDQLNINDNDKIIRAGHSVVSEYGYCEFFDNPFYVKIIHGETFEDFKQRFYQNMKIEKEKIEKAQFMIGDTYSRLADLIELKDGGIVSDVVYSFQNEVMLYILYKSDKKAKKTSASAAYKEKAITINN